MKSSRLLPTEGRIQHVNFVPIGRKNTFEISKKGQYSSGSLKKKTVVMLFLDSIWVDGLLRYLIFSHNLHCIARGQ